MTPTLLRSYCYCERLARREAANFYHAFRILPNAQRRAMCALYAFLRVTDDLTDGVESSEVKQEALTTWLQQLVTIQVRRYSHPLHAALHDTVQTYGIPFSYLKAAIEGVGMDLQFSGYATFDDLYRYCYRVASVVGLSCIHIWGFASEKAKDYAEKAGIAFQMTNILRDLAEDAERGRVYLPREDLERFGYDEEQLRRGDRDDRFRELMRFEVARTRSYYDASAGLVPLLQPAGRAVFLVMQRTYRGLLDAIEERDYDVFSGRVGISSWRKLALVAQALPVRWGWA